MSLSTPLGILHLLLPILPSLPLPFLARPRPEAIPEPEGITPISVRTVTPRRGFTLVTLLLLSLASALDSAILVGRFVTDNASDIEVSDLRFAGELVLAFGGWVVWAVAAIVAEWRGKWSSRSLVWMGLLALGVEIPNLVLLAIQETRPGPAHIFRILSIVPSALRTLLLPVLITLVLRPIVKYERVSERSGLLAGDAESTDPSPSSTARADATSTYGTFDATKPVLRIPKNLGEVRKDDKPMNAREILDKVIKLSPYLWPSTSRRLQLYVVIIILIVGSIRITNPLSPIAFGNLIRALTLNQGAGTGGYPDAPSPWKPFLIWFALKFYTSGPTYYVQQYLWIPVSQYTDREMMILCFDRLLDLSLSYHTKRNTGEVLKVIDRGSAINNLFETFLFTAMPTFFDIFIGVGVFTWLYGWQITIMTFVIMVAYGFITIRSSNARRVERKKITELDVKKDGIIADMLANWESVKYFTSEARESRRYRDAVVAYQTANRTWRNHYNVLYLVQNFILTFGLMCGVLVISLRVLRGELDAAEVVVFLQYYNQMSSPVANISWLYRVITTEATDAQKMFTLLSQPTEIKDEAEAKDLVITDGIIEFRDVHFSYDGKDEALKGVSFTVGKNQSLALVGQSGSGKSTILRLLYRFYDVTSGQIFIDGQDISKVTQHSLRKAIGIVPQDSVLWNDTIGANIAYGKEGATDEEVIKAAEAAKLHDKILGFNEGYETVVGERGIRLSGGEKQRVSLARMFLKNPRILVLDEATSALDTETERDIQRALASLSKDRSSLSIAHRLSTIINSDQIVVMREGQVVENGSYKELLRKNGAFATMWKSQIHTEAEMVAEANGTDLDKVEADLINMAEDAAASTPAASATPMETSDDEGGEDADDHDDGDEAEPDTAKPAGLALDSEAKPAEPAKLPAQEGYDIEESSELGTSPYAETIKASHSQVASPSADPELPTTFADAAKKSTESEGTSAPEEQSGPSITIDDAPADDQPSTFAEAVKMSSEPLSGATGTESVTAAETEPHVIPPPTDSPAKSAVAFPTIDTPSSSPSTRKSTDRPPSPTKVAFPGLPQRLSTSMSVHSQLSQASSTSDGADTDSKQKGEDKDKRRKRLSSIKGFVRRISDQGGLSRSPSTRSQGARSPMAQEVSEETAMLGGGSSPAEGGASAEVEPQQSKQDDAKGKKDKKKKKGKK